MSSREWLWPAITASTSELISRASSTISPTKSGAADSSCDGPPACASTTIARTPRSWSTGTQRFTASEMSVKRKRAACRSSRNLGVERVVTPMNPTLTPARSITAYGGRPSSPSRSTVLAAT